MKIENDEIENLIELIDYYKFKIDEYEKMIKSCESKLQECFSHYTDGSKTYKYNNYKITLTTGFNYILDKDVYNRLNRNDLITLNYPIVKETMKYDLNKKAIRDCEEKGTEEEKKILRSFIHKSPKKLHVLIKLNLQEAPIDEVIE